MSCMPFQRLARCLSPDANLAAAACGAAAFADVAASGRAHLGAADEAERRVRGASLVRFQQLGRAVRALLGTGRWFRLPRPAVRGLAGRGWAG